MTTPDRMLTVRQVAELTGYSEWTIRKFCRQGLLKSGRRKTTSRARKGVKILIPETALADFINPEAAA